MIKNLYSFSCKVPLILSDFNEKNNFLGSVSKNTQTQNFMKIHPVGAELFFADRRNDERTDMTKLIVTFRNFANAPNKCDQSELILVAIMHRNWANKVKPTNSVTN